MNTTRFIDHVTRTLVDLCNCLGTYGWTRINWKTQCHIPTVIEALKDEREEVRYVAAWMLSKLDVEAKIAVPALIEALKDEQGEVRCLSAKTLWRISKNLEIPTSVLIKALGDDESYVRDFALKILESKQLYVNPG
jgi:HEAT repeat protein